MVERVGKIDVPGAGIFGLTQTPSSTLHQPRDFPPQCSNRATRCCWSVGVNESLHRIVKTNDST
eukprot:scaffold474603_cov28-Prasinocladus_malaysianus.AAC.1